MEHFMGLLQILEQVDSPRRPWSDQGGGGDNIHHDNAEQLAEDVEKVCLIQVTVTPLNN